MADRAPDFKTIADLRRDNGEAVRKVCKEFVLLCRRMKLFTDGIVAIEGSKFKAVNNRDKNFTDRKLAARIEQLEDSIKRYLVELDRADRNATAVLPGRVAHLKDKIAKVKQQMQALDAIGEQMKSSQDGQISLTDTRRTLDGHRRPRHGHRGLQRADYSGCQVPPHRGPRGHQRGSRPGPVGRYGQACQCCHRRRRVGCAGRSWLLRWLRTLECDRVGVAAGVPKPMTSNNLADGLYDKRDFVYDAKKDQYRCPAARIAIHRFTTAEAGKTQHKYWSSDCP